MKKTHLTKWYVVLLSLYGLGGCARLDYVKVPTPTQYDDRWTDEDQRKADALKGVRYYLPRPFLHLKQSVPVAQRVAFISFHFDEGEGGYVLDLPQNPPTWLQRAAPRKISITQALAMTLSKTGVKAAKQQAGGVGGEDAPPEIDTPSTLNASTGFINQSDPVTQLSDKMDIVYLPDFEEQYVIRPSIGLGEVQVNTRLRNGWAAEVFSLELNNSQVIPFVIKQIEQASETAAGIVTTWMPTAAGLPPGTSPSTLLELAGIASGAATMESGTVSGDVSTNVARNVLGQVLLFKIAEVRIAQPGVYPILKPREIRQWFNYDSTAAQAQDPQMNFELFLYQAKLPWIRPDMAFVPCPPITMVGFNTTTDIFLTSVTDRAVITAISATPSARKTGNGTAHLPENDALEEMKKDIAQAMEDGKNKLVNDSNLINQQAISIAADATGNSTEITIEPPLTASAFASDEAAIREWIIKVFSPSQDRMLPAADVKVELMDNNKKVIITIRYVSVPDLAKRI
jgi:hypothetical protein